MTREEKKQENRKLLALLIGGVLMLACGLTLFHDISVEQELRQDNVLLAEHITAKEKENTLLREQVEALRKEALDAERRCSELEGEVEALTAQVEDVTFGYDEVCEATGWNMIRGCTVTGYCNCPRCCGQWSGGPTRSGAMPEQGVTVAVDTSVIPMGAEVVIEGDPTVYIAQDTGVHGNWIDLYFSSHGDAVDWGLQHKTVYWRVTT